jgi:hypothetical protein
MFLNFLGFEGTIAANLYICETNLCKAYRSGWIGEICLFFAKYSKIVTKLSGKKPQSRAFFYTFLKSEVGWVYP